MKATQTTLERWANPGGSPDVPAADSGAVFSYDRVYRYHLWRKEQEGKGILCFIMLNPSTADVIKDDPTIRRCRSFARDLGYQYIEIVNLFALRSTNPKILKLHQEPIGEENDEWITATAGNADMVIAAWGVHGSIGGREDAVKKLMDERQKPLYHLGDLTKDGHPRHPLYLKAGLKPQVLR